MVNKMTVHNKLIRPNEEHDKEFKDFMLSDFGKTEKYQEVMRQWAHQSCASETIYVIKGD